MSKKKIIVVVIVSVAVSLGIVIILNTLFKIHSESRFFCAEWEAGDALNYAGTIMGAISTFVLGYIAYKQNDVLCRQNEKLQKIERNNYIANNSSMVVIKDIQIESEPKLQINYDIHDEQMLMDEKSKNNLGNDSTGYKVEIKLERLGEAIPSLIHIEECMFWLGNKNRNTESCWISTKNFRNGYSRIAIYENHSIGFSMTIIVDSENRNKFEKAVKEHRNQLMAEFIFRIVTDKYVATRCKCRAFCDFYYDGIKKSVWKSEAPMVFFYGHELLEKKEIRLTCDTKES